uniref:Aspartic peptidase DDI1-type domain-containing protein n=1 Tax=Lactuca sativa TaxID=4236 RepID=A0A9R1XP46_LACSA|nr:hypothetical protein LSAT_V11C200072510 [Lactuca sativa]
MPYSFFQKLNLPIPEPIQMKIHLAGKTIIHSMGVCEDLLIKVDKLVFPVDFIILDMEEDFKVPIILGRPFLNTACALVDMRESMLTIRVGDDSVIFEAEEKEKHKESKEDKFSSIILDDELLERELAYLLIKEVDYKESLKSVEDSLTRRAVPADSTSTYEKSQSDGNFSLQPISLLCEPYVHVFPDYLENLLEENKVVKDFINFGNAYFPLPETIVESDEAVQKEDKGSL